MTTLYAILLVLGWVFCPEAEVPDLHGRAWFRVAAVVGEFLELWDGTDVSWSDSGNLRMQVAWLREQNDRLREWPRLQAAKSLPDKATCDRNRDAAMERFDYCTAAFESVAERFTEVRQHWNEAIARELREVWIWELAQKAIDPGGNPWYRREAMNRMAQFGWRFP